MKKRKKYVIIKSSLIISIERGDLEVKDIHPNYNQTTITCAGNLRQEVAGGRAEKFKKKYNLA